MLGLILGSFAGLLYVRLPELYLGEDDSPYPVLRAISTPPSHCMSCSRPLVWWHNLPLLSYCLLRGRCAFCRAPIPRCALFFELAGAAMFGGVALASHSLAAAGLLAPLSLVVMVAWSVFGLGLLLLWALDQRYFLLPDGLTLGLLWLALVLSACDANPWLNGSLTAYPSFMASTATLAVLGAAWGYSSFWLIGALFWWWRGTPGLGLGDAKLLAALGAWQGWAALPMIVLIACICGILCASWQRIRTRIAARKRHSRPAPNSATPPDPFDLPAGAIAFGPYLIAAALVHGAWMLWSP